MERDDVDEMQAIARLKRGDVSGLEFLVRVHQVRAVRAAYLVCRDREMSEDAVQAAFVRVYERISQFDHARDFAPWFMKMVVNDATKAATRRRRTVEVDDHTRSVEDTEPAHDEVLERRELRDRVWDALAKLPPKQRAVIVERYYLGLSESEMSERGGLPTGTMKWRLHAARKKLKTLLSLDVFHLESSMTQRRLPAVTLPDSPAKGASHE